LQTGISFNVYTLYISFNIYGEYKKIWGIPGKRPGASLGQTGNTILMQQAGKAGAIIRGGLLVLGLLVPKKKPGHRNPTVK
jgi:hypothetical protein